MSDSVGPCDSICDAAGGGSCFTPWCRCSCHRRTRQAAVEVEPQLWEGDQACTIEPLTGLQLAVLEFERTPWKYPAAKATAILEWFGISETRYYQVLVELLRLPAAEVYDPALVRRLHRLADARQLVHCPAGAAR